MTIGFQLIDKGHKIMKNETEKKNHSKNRFRDQM